MRSLAMVMGVSALGAMFLFGCSNGAESTSSADQGVTEAKNESLATQLCGGSGWVSTDSFQTIAGSYVRAGKAPAGTLASITFSDTSSKDQLRVGGSYTSTFEGAATGATETGAFESLPDNAAFPANILLDPTGGIATGAPSPTSSMYYTLGMKLAANGDISSLCIEHMIDAQTAEPAIVLDRR